MATHTIPILGPGTLPDSSGEVYFAPYSLVDTGTVLDPQVLVYAVGTAKIGCKGTFRVPENYVGTASLTIEWTANATTGNMVFDWSVLPRTATEDMGAAAARTTETVTDAKTGTAFVLESASLTLTDGDYVAGDVVMFELFRDGASDTLAVDAVVFGAYFEYSDA